MKPMKTVIYKIAFTVATVRLFVMKLIMNKVGKKLGLSAPIKVTCLSSTQAKKCGMEFEDLDGWIGWILPTEDEKFFVYVTTEKTFWGKPIWWHKTTFTLGGSVVVKAGLTPATLKNTIPSSDILDMADKMAIEVVGVERVKNYYQAFLDWYRQQPNKDMGTLITLSNKIAKLTT